MRQRLTDHPEILKKAGGSARREIPDDFKYNPKKIKHLKHVLHNVSVALGTLSSALNEFSKLKGPEISPDGLLGGVGYIMPIKDIKQGIVTTVHSLGNIADCIADELTNPRWEIKDDKDVKDLIKEKDEALEKVDDAKEEVPEVDDDINPDDLVNAPVTPELPEEHPAHPVEQAKLASEDKTRDVLASAVRQSLVNFFEIK